MVLVAFSRLKITEHPLCFGSVELSHLHICCCETLTMYTHTHTPRLCQTWDARHFPDGKAYCQNNSETRWHTVKLFSRVSTNAAVSLPSALNFMTIDDWLQATLPPLPSPPPSPPPLAFLSVFSMQPNCTLIPPKSSFQVGDDFHRSYQLLLKKKILSGMKYTL